MNLLDWGLLVITLIACIVTYQTIKRNSLPKQSLKGLRGGVWIRQPNGSAHPIQGKLEQSLSVRGMALFNLQRSAVDDLIRDGVWTNHIAGPNTVDILIIGQLIIKDSPLMIHVPEKRGRTGLIVEEEHYETPPRIYTIDLRFYAPNGKIMGAHNDVFHSYGVDPIPRFVAETIRSLEKTVQSERLRSEPSNI